MCFVRTILLAIAEGVYAYIAYRTYQLPGKKSWNPWWDNSLPNQQKRKKVNFIVVYRSPSQTADKFNLFLDRLELTVENIQAKKPDCIIITGDFNYRTQQWWSGDIEDPHGTALDDLMQSKNLCQLKTFIVDKSWWQIFFKLLELTILVVNISISRKKYAYRSYQGISFKGLDNKIIGFIHI